MSETNSAGAERLFGQAWTAWPTRPVPAAADLLRAAVAQARQALGPGAEPAAVQEAALRRVMELHGKREAAIAAEQHDPLGCGWESPVMSTARALLAGTYRPGHIGTSLVGPDWQMERPANDLFFGGGTGSGKSYVCAKLCVEVALRLKDGELRMFSQNVDTSVPYQQNPMHGMLPPQLRNLKKVGNTTSLSWTKKNGFSDGKFVLPNGTTATFRTYAAWAQDPNSVEGGQCNLLWCDEEVPGPLLDTLRARAFKALGTVLVSFTPITGYIESIAQYVEGCTVLEVIPARRVVWDFAANTFTWGEWLLPADQKLVEGCPRGHVPLVIQCAKTRRYGVMCPTMFNPYNPGVDELIAEYVPKGLSTAVQRLYGWATNRSEPAFPRYGRAHQITDRAKLPKWEDLTIYQFIDPHGDRNWATLWFGVTAQGWIIALKEWPGKDYGEWALPGGKGGRGKPGPAQLYEHGKTFDDYKRIYLLEEGWDRTDANGEARLSRPATAMRVEDRRMDPRPAGTSVLSDKENETYLDHMAKPVFGRDGTVLAPGLDIMAAPHVGVNEGEQIINDLLCRGWDETQPLTPLNCPRFYVFVPDCPNLDYALRTCPHNPPDDAAMKDFIDPLKGAAKLGLVWIDAKAPRTRGGGGGY